MAEKRINYLIERMYAGECSRAELNELLELLESTSGGEYEEVLKKLWTELDGTELEESTLAERVFLRTLKKLDQVSSPSQEKARLARKHAFGWAWRVAAGFLLLLSLTVWWYVAEQNVMQVIETTFAEQQSIELPDGSAVELNANSKLTYSKRWNSKEKRKVWLEGEAFFHVEKKRQTKQKFCVITDHLVVEVLGTSFNVNTQQAETQVFLEEGQIKLSTNTDPNAILMQPGEMYSYSLESGRVTKSQAMTAEPTSWRDGLILMKDAKLTDILEKINQIYGLDYQLLDKTHLDRAFTIAIPTDNYETMYEVLQQTTGLTIERHELELLIK